jgi:hypothetical protein
VADQPAIPVELPPIPAEAREAWAYVEANCTGEKILRGMRYVLAGRTYREAEELTGCSRGTIWDGIQRWGLRRHAASTDTIVQRHREVAALALGELLRRLEDGETLDGIPAKELAIISGISSDKVAAKERWVSGQPGSTDLGDTIGRFAAQLAGAGARLQARLTSPDGAVAELEIGPDTPPDGV